ncbi:hypothetical protein [Haloglycomyces albus]|uniref:hypothetical protein n=1 Tax=Haloglycomyces albus TaxID=526067 RepID=UPI00046D42B2|nr:hypothetical protein [Haloglycomyces albus]
MPKIFRVVLQFLQITFLLATIGSLFVAAYHFFGAFSGDISISVFTTNSEAAGSLALATACALVSIATSPALWSLTRASQTGDSAPPPPAPESMDQAGPPMGPPGEPMPPQSAYGPPTNNAPPQWPAN